MARGDESASDLDGWLTPFLDVMGRKTRRTWAPFYLRGLLGPGARKSLQPMAAGLGFSSHDQLQHFIASTAWSDGPLWTVLAQEANRLVGGADACLVIDDTALPKKGTLSVGVARQYCGQLGKKANCQALVSLTLAQGEVPMPIGLRLFLPEAWAADEERCVQAGVPEAEVASRTKGEIALAEIDRIRAAGVRFGCVLADAGYGASAAFRQGLDARGLRWAVGIPCVHKVYGTDVRLVPPQGRGRKPVPDGEPQAAQDVLAPLTWRRVTWREGTKGALTARFAAIRVRVADGAAWANNRHLPGEEAWLVGEWRTSGERKYARAHVAAHTRPCHQGAPGVRAGAPAAQGRVGPRPLRGPLLDWAAPARADVLHRVHLPAAPAPRRTKPDGAGEKCGPVTPCRWRSESAQISNDIGNPSRGDTENPSTPATVTPRRVPVRVLL